MTARPRTGPVARIDGRVAVVTGANGGIGGALARALATCAVAGMLEGRFTILPHPGVAGYVRAKAADPDRWIAGMARLRARELAAC